MRYRPAIVRLASRITAITWAAVIIITIIGGVLHLRRARG
jgi:hypothetical protein